MVCHREDNYYEYFDSLGSSSIRVKQTLHQFVGKCDFNETALQARESIACGEFCIFYVVQQYFNEDLDFFDLMQEFFSADVEKNELYVNAFIKKLLK